MDRRARRARGRAAREGGRYTAADAAELRATHAQRPRVYIERLTLHPVDATISLELGSNNARDDDDDDDDGGGGGGGGGNPVVGVADFLASFLSNLATVSHAPLRLNSFDVEHVLEAPAMLGKQVGDHYKRQVLTELLKIVGSMQALGNPANLVHSIGGGVKEFFSSPRRARSRARRRSCSGSGAAPRA